MRAIKITHTPVSVTYEHNTFEVAGCQTALGPKGADSLRSEAVALATLADATRRVASSTMGKVAAACVGKEKILHF